MSWRLLRTSPLVERSFNIHKSGQIPQYPKRTLDFINDETGEYFQTTDLDIRISKRRKKFQLFQDVYLQSFIAKDVTILLVVVSKEVYNVSDFISFFKKKLSRKSIQVLGYVWTNDVGDEKFREHIHFMIAVRRLSTTEIKSLIFKDHSDYNLEPCNSIKAFKKYLLAKELYNDFKKRSWGCSSKFQMPSKKNIELHNHL